MFQKLTLILTLMFTLMPAFAQQTTQTTSGCGDSNCGNRPTGTPAEHAVNPKTGVHDGTGPVVKPATGSYATPAPAPTPAPSSKPAPAPTPAPKK